MADDRAARGPQRMCAGCRRVAPAHELLRFVASDGALVADPQRRLPGRGVHLHLDPDDPRGVRAACVAAALRKRALARGLRASGLDQRILENGP